MLLARIEQRWMAHTHTHTEDKHAGKKIPRLSAPRAEETEYTM